jgi:hypothetical protein
MSFCSCCDERLLASVEPCDCLGTGSTCEASYSI